MIYKIIFVFALVISIPAFAQNAPEKVEIVEIDEDSVEVPFSIIENVPVYKGCDETLTNSDLRNCMSDNISKHVMSNFNIKVAKGLGLPDGPIKILTIFKVDKNGDVTGIKISAPHPALEKESYRVIQSIPKFTRPGFQKGKPVTVPYSLPIVFNVVNSKSSKQRGKE